MVNTSCLLSGRGRVSSPSPPPTPISSRGVVSIMLINESRFYFIWIIDHFRCLFIWLENVCSTEVNWRVWNKGHSLLTCISKEEHWSVWMFEKICGLWTRVRYLLLVLSLLEVVLFLNRLWLNWHRRRTHLSPFFGSLQFLLNVIQGDVLLGGWREAGNYVRHWWQWLKNHLEGLTRGSFVDRFHLHVCKSHDDDKSMWDHPVHQPKNEPSSITSVYKADTTSQGGCGGGAAIGLIWT